MLNNFADFSFTETAFSGYQSRTIVDRGQNTVKSIDRIYAELAAKGLGTNKLDNCFRGLHRFEQGIIAHVDAGKPINDWPGKYLSDFIPLDLDNSEASHLAVPDFQGLIEAIYSKGLNVTEAKRYSFCLTGLKGMETKIHAGAIGYEPEHDFAKIARRFVELLLPGKVGKNTWVDASIYQPARLTRIIGSFNAPKNDEEAEKTKEKIRGFKVELIWEEVAAVVEKDAKLVYELSKAPNDRGINEDTVSGARYWKCEPVPYLQALWQQAKETFREEKRTQVQGTSFAPLQAQSKFARHPACVARLLQIIENGDCDNELAGIRHDTLFKLSTYVWNGMGLASSPVAYEVFMREQHEKLPESKRLPAVEFSQILRDAPKYTFSCGNSGTNLIKFCNSACIKKPDLNRRWQSPLEMFPQVSDYFQRVVTPFKIGLSHIDDFMGGLDRKSINIFIGDPNVGKTMIGLQSLLKMAVIAKELDFVVAFISPEEDLASLVSNVTMQFEKKPKGTIYREFVDQGIPNFRSWCEEFENHVRFVDGNVLTAAGIQKQLEEIRQSTGKQLPVFYLDNITLVRLAASNLQHGVNYSQKIADELKELVYNMGAAMIGTLHMPKASGNRQTRKGKDGRSYSKSVPELMDGFGTNFWAILSSAQWGLSKRDRFLMCHWTKCRKRQHGDELLPKPFPLLVTRYYRALEYSEVLAMPDAYERFPDIDMNEFEALDRGIDSLEASDDKPKTRKSKSVLDYAGE